MQNQHVGITPGSYYQNACEPALSVVRMSEVLSVADDSVVGYQLIAGPAFASAYGASVSEAPAGRLFLTSDVGVCVWSEYDGLMQAIDGKVNAYLIESPRGPIINFYSDASGTMGWVARIRCVDLLGMAPGSPTNVRLNEYRDLLAAVRLSNINLIH